MENASKALIIAGAVLLSIIIISLGIYLVTVARNSMDTGAIDEANVEAFNSNFQNYEKEIISGAEVKAMMNKVISTNANETNIGKGISITVTLDGNAITSTSSIKTTKNYKVEITAYTKGRVSTIEITTL